MTSYYKRDWGFAALKISKKIWIRKVNTRYSLTRILKGGKLNYGEIYFPGKQNKKYCL